MNYMCAEFSVEKKKIEMIYFSWTEIRNLRKEIPHL